MHQYSKFFSDAVLSRMRKDVYTSIRMPGFRHSLYPFQISIPLVPSRKDLLIIDRDLKLNLLKVSSPSLCPSAHKAHEKRANENMQASVNPASTTKNLPTIVAEKVLGQELDERLEREKPR